MEIRLLKTTDAEEYWRIRLEALKQHPEAFSTSYEEAIRRENPIQQVSERFTTEGDFTYGAFENNNLIGVVTLVLEKQQKLKHRANIVAMYVTPNHTRSGVGTALLIEAILKAKSCISIEKVNLTVNASNEKAKKLYKKLGFKVFGIEERALKVKDTYFDEEHMVLFT